MEGSAERPGSYHVGAEDEHKVGNRLPLSACGAGGLCLHVPGHHACKLKVKSALGASGAIESAEHHFYDSIKPQVHHLRCVSGAAEARHATLRKHPSSILRFLQGCHCFLCYLDGVQNTTEAWASSRARQRARRGCCVKADKT